jgi:hypothetical protein
MKTDAIASNTQNELKRQSHKASFAKVVDGRKRPRDKERARVRGLSQGVGVFRSMA